MKTIIVAGITRSGLTLTMQMLNAGGYPCIGEYPSFEDPNHIISTNGKANKSVDTQHDFPQTGDYYVIIPKRDYKQQSKSQAKFMRILGLPVSKSDTKRLEKSLKPDYCKIFTWAKRQNALLNLKFEDLIEKPMESAIKIKEFVDYPLDTYKMVDCVIERSTDCYDGMIENELLKNL